eukprot:m51a1_g1041 hypothetical protein (714) ;mRNA; r:720801-730415
MAGSTGDPVALVVSTNRIARYSHFAVSVVCDTQWMSDHRLGCDAIRAACAHASVRLEGDEHGDDLGPCARCCGVRPQKLITIRGSCHEESVAGINGRSRVFLFNRCMSTGDPVALVVSTNRIARYSHFAVSVVCDTQWMSDHRLGCDAIRAACAHASVRLEGDEHGDDLGPCARCCGVRPQTLITIKGSCHEEPAARVVRVVEGPLMESAPEGKAGVVVSIVGTSLVEGARARSAHVVYHVVLRCGTHALRLMRRFSECSRAHWALRDRLLRAGDRAAADAMPKFPPKRAGAGPHLTDPARVALRVAELQQYWTALLKIPGVLVSAALFDAFEITASDPAVQKFRQAVHALGRHLLAEAAGAPPPPPPCCPSPAAQRKMSMTMPQRVLDNDFFYSQRFHLLAGVVAVQQQQQQQSPVPVRAVQVEDMSVGSLGPPPPGPAPLPPSGDATGPLGRHLAGDSSGDSDDDSSLSSYEQQQQQPLCGRPPSISSPPAVVTCAVASPSPQVSGLALVSSSMGAAGPASPQAQRTAAAAVLPTPIPALYYTHPLQFALRRRFWASDKTVRETPGGRGCGSRGPPAGFEASEWFALSNMSGVPLMYLARARQRPTRFAVWEASSDHGAGSLLCEVGAQQPPRDYSGDTGPSAAVQAGAVQYSRETHYGLVVDAHRDVLFFLAATVAIDWLDAEAQAPPAGSQGLWRHSTPTGSRAADKDK